MVILVALVTVLDTIFCSKIYLIQQAWKCLHEMCTEFFFVIHWGLVVLSFSRCSPRGTLASGCLFTGTNHDVNQWHFFIVIQPFTKKKVHVYVSFVKKQGLQLVAKFGRKPKLMDWGTCIPYNISITAYRQMTFWRISKFKLTVWVCFRNKKNEW